MNQPLFMGSFSSHHLQLFAKFDFLLQHHLYVVQHRFVVLDLHFVLCQILINHWHFTRKQNFLYVVVSKYVQLLLFCNFIILILFIVYGILNFILICLSDSIIFNSLQLVLLNLKVQTILQIPYFLLMDKFNKVLYSFMNERVLHEAVFEHAPV